jgi:hypothetical protein
VPNEHPAVDAANAGKYQKAVVRITGDNANLIHARTQLLFVGVFRPS